MKYRSRILSQRSTSTRNIQPPDALLQQGGLIKNMQMTVEGPIGSKANLLKGIIVNDFNPNVTIDGGTISYPDGSPTAEVGPFGVKRPAPTRPSVI